MHFQQQIEDLRKSKRSRKVHKHPPRHNHWKKTKQQNRLWRQHLKRQHLQRKKALN
jgi:hypothetical protein